MSNPETVLTLDEAVAEVLGLLTGLDLQYAPEQDRYYSIARAINRALRSNALEHEWSWYASIENIGTAVAGATSAPLLSTRRLRIVGDDAVRLVDAEDNIMRWAYFLPRDALQKYAYRNQLYCAMMPTALLFSRPFFEKEDGLTIQVPVMREPTMIRLPLQSEDPNDASTPVDPAIRDTEIDFWYPDLIVLRAAFYYAQTDPVMQPRVQTLEAQYKDIMYQIIERDDRNNEAPEQTAWSLGISGSLRGEPSYPLHPHADGRG
jgi:hypothetical protein